MEFFAALLAIEDKRYKLSFALAGQFFVSIIIYHSEGRVCFEEESGGKMLHHLVHKLLHKNYFSHTAECVTERNFPAFYVAMLNTAHLTLCRRKDCFTISLFAFSQRPFSRINDGFYLSPIWKIYSNAFPYTEKSSRSMVRRSAMEIFPSWSR